MRQTIRLPILVAIAALLTALAVAPAAAQRNKEKPLPRGWVRLFNGKDTTGWKLRHENGKNAWKVESGVLANTEPSTDIATVEKFGDFELHIEFCVPKGGNSGVYLQGRYEIQVDDCYGQQNLRNSMCGAIYSKLSPSQNAAKPAGEWQTFDVVFRQARRDASGKVVQKAVVTVLHNGVKVIDNKEIDGITGGAMDGEEGTPGPLMLQGDHTAIQYRNIRIKPIRV